MIDDITVSESGYLEDTDEVIESIKRMEITLNEERNNLSGLCQCSFKNVDG